MTEPTDAELWQFYMTLPGATPTSQPDPIEIMRATLAKWGTPPVVAGEPIGHLYCGGSYGDELQDWEIVADPYQCDKLNEHYRALGKEAKLPIYTAPQPTQSQTQGG